MPLIDTLAEAFLAAVQAQSHPRQPSPVVYRADGDLRDVQFVGQIDVIAAMRLAVLALRDAAPGGAPAMAVQDDGSGRVGATLTWTTMIDALLAD